METASDILALIGIIAILLAIWFFVLKPAYSKAGVALKARSAAKSAAALLAQHAAVAPVLAPVVDRVTALEAKVVQLSAKVGVV